ncbi:MAG: HelD family protein [Motilibacteraceae bacterium]
MPAPAHPPDPADPSRTADPVLTAESAYLAGARADLAAMRERTLALQAVGGDAVSAAYLEATLHHRARSLLDDPGTPLFFGRTDVADGELSGRWYVGRRHVHDAGGDPVVVDWRAEVSRPFYRATRTEPMGVTLRRRYGFERGRLTAYEDEHLTDTTEADRASGILAAEIERPRTGPMRDIVATIQPEQDLIVRADVHRTLVVQGAPGTGKTAVGLHRAAYLLYAHRERLARYGVLVVGPNNAFLSYIGSVLPALGEVEVRQTTVEQLTARVPARAVDEPDVGVLKGDARMAEVVRRAVWSHVAEPEEPLVVPRGSRRWRVPTYAVSEMLDEVRARGVRYGAGRAMLPQKLAHLVLVQMEAAGDSPDDRVQDAVARSRPVRAYADALWPAVDPVRVVLRLLSDPGSLAAAAEGVLTDEEQARLLWAKAPKGPASARWSAADAVLVDEAADVVEREPALGHVVLDEAQDLSPMQLRVVGRRCSTGSATVLGDVAQGTTPWATPSWREALAHLGKPDADVEVLDRGYRVPASVIDFAARLLPTIAPGLGAPVAVREHPGVLEVRPVGGDPLAAAVAACRESLAEEGSVGLIVADAAVASVSRALDRAGLEHALLGGEQPDDDEREQPPLVLVPATLAKGLEYDRVVVVEPADIVEAEPRGLRRLYVVLTRAVSALTVVHARPLPAQLVDAVVA